MKIMKDTLTGVLKSGVIYIYENVNTETIDGVPFVTADYRIDETGSSYKAAYLKVFVFGARLIANANGGIRFSESVLEVVSGMD